MQEYENNILEKYDIDIRSTRKTRGAVLCDTEQGLFLLKEVNVPAERIQALVKFYDFVDNQEWCEVDRIIPNNEGEYISGEENGSKYILKKWFQGRECDIKRPEELLEASGVLAKLHLLMKEGENEIASDAVRIDEEYERHNRELKKVRSFVRKYSPKGEFELEFLKSFDEMYRWAETGREMIMSSQYNRLREESMNKNTLVHGEYNYHNILMSESRNQSTLLAVTSFDKFKRDIQVEDFYYFLRKVMEKYGWKERLGDNMLNAYSAVKPLSEEELEYIKLRLVYPEKFWKIANAYYHSNKAWIPVKNMEKLSTAIRQTKEKERFLKTVFAFSL